MTDTVAAGQLRAFVERIERIEADIKEMNADKSEVYKELRGVGFDVKAVRQCVAKRKLDDAERQEQESLFDMYWGALTGGPRVHVHEDHEIQAPKTSPEAMAKSTAHIDTLSSEKGLAKEQSNPDSSGGMQDEEAIHPATLSDEDVPAFLRKPVNIRPHCLHPELCAGCGRTHCGSCLKASSHSEAA